jgi:hypothetical protein
MVNKTSEYYTQLSSTMPASGVQKWEAEIKSAESRRLENPKAMDIVGVKPVILNAGSARLEPDSSRLTSAISEWLELALSIEERQYVIESKI